MNEIPDTKSLRIEYRHLAFLFLGAVCVCAVFFALGFVVGRAQAFETALSSSDDAKGTASGAINPSSATTAPANETPAALAEVSGKAEDARQRPTGADYRKDLDFYAAVKESKVDQNFHPESEKPNSTGSAKKGSLEPGSRGGSSSVRQSGNRSGLSLQVAALKSSADADRLAKTLKSKGYPVFIVNPAKDDPGKLVRVQIGPYTSEADAAKAKARLGSDGFTAITKR